MYHRIGIAIMSLELAGIARYDNIFLWPICSCWGMFFAAWLIEFTIRRLGRELRHVVAISVTKNGKLDYASDG